MVDVDASGGERERDRPPEVEPAEVRPVDAAGEGVALVVVVHRPPVAPGQHGEAAVLGRGVVEEEPHREHVVVRVGVERGVLVPLDWRADLLALEVQLAVVELDVGADQLRHDRRDRGLEGHPAVERVVVGGILDSPQDRALRRVTGIEVEHGAARSDAPGLLDELVRRRPECLELRRVDHVPHREVAVTMVGGDLLRGQMSYACRGHEPFLPHGRFGPHAPDPAAPALILSRSARPNAIGSFYRPRSRSRPGEEP